MASPVAFGYKMAWLAIRTDDPMSVVEALGLEDMDASPWPEAIEGVYARDAMADRPAFVTPTLDGWILVVSPGLFDEVSDADPERLATYVSETARLCGTEVQLFATHRVVEGHAWARADPEGIGRAFYYLGEIGEQLVDEGEPTPIERSRDLAPPDEETVMAVAGAWSVDPTRLEEEHPEVADGWLGRFPAPSLSFPQDLETTRAADRPWWKFW